MNVLTATRMSFARLSSVALRGTADQVAAKEARAQLDEMDPGEDKIGLKEAGLFNDVDYEKPYKKKLIEEKLWGDVMKAVEKNEGGKVEEIDPETLIVSQGEVHKKVVEKMIDDPPSEPLTVFEYEGKKYLWDGHHRAVAAILANRSIEARVYKVESFTKDGASAVADAAIDLRLWWAP